MRILPLFLLCTATLIPLNAETFFTLRGITVVTPVIEISGSKVPQSEKAYIRDAVNAMTEELGIETTSDNQRSLAVLVDESYSSGTPVINVRLIVGEQVRRLDSAEKVFGLTYQNVASFAYHADSVTENLEDTVDELTAKFSEQYAQENGAVKRVAEKDGDIAAALGYETNYAKAVEKAKREHKNVMLVLVAGYCPWCRKFEQQVLRKEDVNALVHAKYVPVILDKDKDAFPKEFNLSFTPIVQFIDPQTQQSYHRTVGYNEHEEFVHWLRSDTHR